LPEQAPEIGVVAQQFLSRAAARVPPPENASQVAIVVVADVFLDGISAWLFLGRGQGFIDDSTLRGTASDEQQC
jgi:hypothetical protein